MSEEHSLRESAAAYRVTSEMISEANDQAGTQNTAQSTERVTYLRPWRPGQSGNPGGRPKGAAGLAALIRDLTNDGRKLVDVAMKIVDSPKTADKDRIRALELLFSRGYGAPIQTIEGSGVNIVNVILNAEAQQADDLAARLGIAGEQAALEAPEPETDAPEST